MPLAADRHYDEDYEQDGVGGELQSGQRNVGVTPVGATQFGCTRRIRHRLVGVTTNRTVVRL